MRRLFLLFSCLCLLIISVVPAWAKEPATPELSLQQAVEMAKNYSRSLKLAGYDIDRSNEVRDAASDSVLYTPIGPTSDASFKTYLRLVQAEINRQKAERSYTAEEDTVVLKTYQSYNDLLLAREKRQLAAELLKSAQWQHHVAAVSYRVGTINNMELLQAEYALASAKAGMESADKSLADAYENFNLLVGLWPEDRPVLTDLPVYEELIVDDLDYEVAKALAASPSIWLLEKNIDLAKLALDLHDFTAASADPYDAKEIDLAKAKITAASSKDQFRDLIRTMYYTVKQLEEQYKTAQENVRTLEEALRVVNVKYDVGMATNSDVYTAEILLAQAKQSLLDIAGQHQELSYAFHKPWAYASS